MFSTREIRVPEDLRSALPWQWHDDPILPALYAEAGAPGVPLALPEARGVTTVTLNESERQRWVRLFDRTRARLAGTVSDPAWIARVQTAGRAH